MKIENIEVYGFRAALRGMRNPMDSWDKSDTVYNYGEQRIYCNAVADFIEIVEAIQLGGSDLKLACKLINGGTEHRKFLRQIIVWCDLTLPRYIWTELDTYKVATVRNSCSTMHKLGHRDLEHDDFEGGIVNNNTLAQLNKLGQEYRQTKNYDLVREMKATIPESFLQKATYMMNYETALSMYFQRRNHRLPEWNENNKYSICSFIKVLPYMSEFIEAGEKRS